MRQKYLALATISAFLSVSISLAAGLEARVDLLPIRDQQVTAAADGAVCTYSPNENSWHCRSFAITQYRSPSGKYVETRAWAEEDISDPGSYSYRRVECMVGRGAIHVTPNQAWVQVLLEPASDFCVNSGGIEIYGSTDIQPWSFEASFTLEAELLEPGLQDQMLIQHSWKDNETGESSHQQCQSRAGYNILGGGMLIAGLYFPYGPDDASGHFYYEKCGATSK